jgi:hypothetical protein
MWPLGGDLPALPAALPFPAAAILPFFLGEFLVACGFRFRGGFPFFVAFGAAAGLVLKGVTEVSSKCHHCKRSLSLEEGGKRGTKKAKEQGITGWNYTCITPPLRASRQQQPCCLQLPTQHDFIPTSPAPSPPHAHIQTRTKCPQSSVLHSRCCLCGT